MSLLGSLKKTGRENVCILVVTDSLTTVMRYTSLRRTTSSTVATVFLELRIYALGAPLCVLADNGTRLVAKFFGFVCGIMGSKHYVSRAYHLLTVGQTERLSKATMQRPRYYVADHQAHRDHYVQMLADPCSVQAHQTAEATYSGLSLTIHPPSITLLRTSDQTGTSASDESLSVVKYKQDVFPRLYYAME